MNGICDISGRRGIYTGFRWGNNRQIICMENFRVDRRIMIKCDLKETGWQDIDWIYLALDSGKLPNLIDKVTSLWVQINARDFFIH